jgi:hypothetical protein
MSRTVEQRKVVTIMKTQAQKQAPIFCSICNNPIKPGHSFVWIIRSRVRDLGLSEDEREFNEAIVAMCDSCIEKIRSGEEELNSYHIPKPIFPVERDGFYWYINHRDGPDVAWNFDKYKYKCSVCGCDVLRFLHHILIRINEYEVLDNGYFAPIEDTDHDLGLVCKECFGSHNMT